TSFSLTARPALLRFVRWFGKCAQVGQPRRPGGSRKRWITSSCYPRRPQSTIGRHRRARRLLRSTRRRLRRAPRGRAAWTNSGAPGPFFDLPHGVGPFRRFRTLDRTGVGHDFVCIVQRKVRRLVCDELHGLHHRAVALAAIERGGEDAVQAFHLGIVVAPFVAPCPARRLAGERRRDEREER